MKTPLQALIEQGKKLKVAPETFEVSMGRLKGRAISIDVVETVDQGDQKIVTSDGQVITQVGRASYQSTIRVVWDVESAKEVIAESRDELMEYAQRLMSLIQYGDVANPSSILYEPRE